EHCFDGPGKYEVNLHVVDTLINEELSSVASYDLELTPNKQIWFTLPDSITTEDPVSLEAELRGYEKIPDDPVFFWDFGNGETRIGKNISYIYDEPGDYRVTCATELKDGRKICFFREIKVSGSKQSGE
ncbi:MAG: PKD domain-containing protein, partial [Marinilabiliaceae bacterium]